MINSQLIIIGALGVFTLLAFGLRALYGRSYSVLLGAITTVFFGLAYINVPDFWASIVEDGGALVSQNIVILERIFGTLFWLSVAYLINGLIKRFVYTRRLTWMGDSMVPLVIQYLITLLIFLIALFLTLSLVFEKSIAGVVAASGAVLLVMGYSARSMLDELFAGLAININSAFEKGDLIQLNDEWGYVVDVDWRTITYQDMDSNFVTVPNTRVAASKIRNLDRPSTMTRRTLFIRVEYNVPPKIVVDTCNDALAECPHIAPHPWNFTSYFDCDEKGMRYKLHFHVAHYDDWYVASDELLNAIWYRFARKRIRFAHQRRLNFIEKSDEERGLPDSVWDEDNWHALNKRFRQVPMFEGMDAVDTEELARSARLHIVGPPERIIRAGSRRTSMFLIGFGSADVYEVNDDEKETFMAEVGESETIGLIAFLTGSPQKTTIRAKEECAVWEISSEALHALFDRKPEIMESIAANVAKWQAEEDAAIRAIAKNRQQEKQYIRRQTDRLIDRISRFFQRSQGDVSSEEFNDY